MSGAPPSPWHTAWWTVRYRLGQRLDPLWIVPWVAMAALLGLCMAPGMMMWPSRESTIELVFADPVHAASFGPALHQTLVDAPSGGVPWAEVPADVLETGRFVVHGSASEEPAVRAVVGAWFAEVWVHAELGPPPVLRCVPCGPEYAEGEPASMPVQLDGNRTTRPRARVQPGFRARRHGDVERVLGSAIDGRTSGTEGSPSIRPRPGVSRPALRNTRVDDLGVRTREPSVVEDLAAGPSGAMFPWTLGWLVGCSVGGRQRVNVFVRLGVGSRSGAWAGELLLGVLDAGLGVLLAAAALWALGTRVPVALALWTPFGLASGRAVAARWGMMPAVFVLTCVGPVAMVLGLSALVVDASTLARITPWLGALSLVPAAVLLVRGARPPAQARVRGALDAFDSM